MSKKQAGLIKFFPYLILISFFTLLVFLFRGYPLLQFTASSLMVLSYLGWSFYHHLLHGDLHFKNMIEYILLSALAEVILYFLFLT